MARLPLSEYLTGASLFATLEPCAPGARSPTKTSCAERIVNRRIKEVWVGIEDPDPLVDSKGINYLIDNGVAVEMFDRDLQDSIRFCNSDFIEGAEERAARFIENTASDNLSRLEEPLSLATFADLNVEEVETFIRKIEEFNFEYGSEEFYRVFVQLKYLTKTESGIQPTGLGVLLFGKNPQVYYPHAVIRATYKIYGGGEEIATFSGSLLKQARDSHEWFKNVIGKRIDRSNSEREELFDYPSDVIRESIHNALTHRSYDIEGASIHLEIGKDSIVIRSPGGPVKPISIERMKRLDAPYLSKNPKISFAFEKLGLSENRGLGFTTMRNLPTKYMLPLPNVTFDDPYLIFTFFRAYGNEKTGTLSGIENKGLDFIRLNSPIMRREYAENMSISQKMAERHLAKFVKLNLIRRTGSGPTTAYIIV